jgi:chromosome segregation ATPase
MAMTLEQAQGVMRQLHGQYTTEKAAIAYLDEMLTVIVSQKDEIAAITQSKQAAEDEAKAVQLKLDGIVELYDTKVQEMDNLYAQVKADMAQKIDEAKAVYAKAQTDIQAYHAQCRTEEQAYLDRITVLRATLTDLQSQKQGLDGQIVTLQTQVRAIRESMAGVPA